MYKLNYFEARLRRGHTSTWDAAQVTAARTKTDRLRMWKLTRFNSITILLGLPTCASLCLLSRCSRDRASMTIPNPSTPPPPPLLRARQDTAASFLHAQASTPETHIDARAPGFKMQIPVSIFNSLEVQSAN
ncbi:hypothetical protein C8R47DRAFT_1075030 [Mycena vitilis]|nr:hypothetical protein C8R47DRAFT_1075030 [Mycena vitilis]